MNNGEINLSAPNLMCICVDGRNHSDISGRLYHRGRKQPVPFDNSGQALFEMEMWCDRVGYPQSGVVARKFKTKPPKLDDAAGREWDKRPVQSGGRETEEAMLVAGEEILNKEGKEGTFVVHIKYRQNATWQGQVTWAEKKQTCSFRSALELLKLIDSALDEEKKQGG